MMPPMEYFSNLGFGAETIYSFVIIICSLMIYYGTRELYELSSYKGIKYFRQAFLFFSIAYFFRSSIKFVLDYFNKRNILDFSPGFGQFSLLFFMYFSSMAIFYLTYSLMWKRWNGNSKKIYLFHALAVIISVISILQRDNIVYFGMNLFLLVYAGLIFYISHQDQKGKKKKNNLYAIYGLLFVFWIFNVINILIPDFFQNIQLFIYLISLGIFLIILYKVLKKTGSD